MITPEHQKRRLKPLCRTRWVESNEAYVTFRELLHPIVRTLDMIADEGGDSGVRANELRSAICKCDFVVSLFVTERFAALFLPLSIQLQSKDLDIFEAREAIDSMAELLQDSRKTAGPDFKKLYRDATAACAELEIDVSLPRRCDRQTHRENYAVDSVEDYFRVSIYPPYLHQLIEEFGALFKDIQENALKLQFLVPKFIERSSFDDLVDAFAFYEADLRCSNSAQCFRTYNYS